MKSFEKNLAEKLTFKRFRATKEKKAFDIEVWSDETREQVCAGAVLRLKSGALRLVGDCNELLGVCDDCTEFDYDNIVEIAHIDQLLKGKKRKSKKS